MFSSNAVFQPTESCQPGKLMIFVFSTFLQIGFAFKLSQTAWPEYTSTSENAISQYS